MTTYQQMFRMPDFRRFWIGFTFSVIGDALTRVALTWSVYSLTHSAEALGWLMLCFTGPIVVGGLIAGWLLLGGTLAGALLPLLGIPIVIGLSALLVGLPGLFGIGVKALRHDRVQ